MIVRIQQIKLPPKHTMEDVKSEICRILYRRECKKFVLVKKSIDARKKNDIRYVYTVDVDVAEDKYLKTRIQKNPNLSVADSVIYQFPVMGDATLMHRPVIVGTGPAGLFCGLLLARNGYRPILLERGACVEERERQVNHFWSGGSLDQRTNVQFGEGGAGTFSDGKLNTLIKDTCGRNRKVMECFVEAGAPEEILYTHKAHIGTDILRKVVKNIRQEIERLGGEVHFDSQVTDLEFQEDHQTGGKSLAAVRINGEKRLPCEVCVLAIGHSARDTFALLHQRGLLLTQKSFAVGVRVEHPQRWINKTQYGEADNPYLPPADYKVTYQASNGRSIYSFCMCPGGYVVNASSEEGRLAINGMSYHDRSGENGNSALIVSVTPKDYAGDHPLAGVTFQRGLEEAAWRAGGGAVPVQRYEDFKKNRPSKGAGEFMPCIKGAYTFTNLRDIFPDSIAEALIEGIEYFGTKLEGFNRPDALLSAVESRSSSPVRIERKEDFESKIKGIYPCGEGAGYAGGITSAAMDGIKIAEAIAKRYHA